MIKPALAIAIRLLIDFEWSSWLFISLPRYVALNILDCCAIDNDTGVMYLSISAESQGFGF